MEVVMEGFHGSHVGGLAETMKLHEIRSYFPGVLFLPFNMAAMTSHENAL